MSDTKHDIAGLIDQMTQAIDAVRPSGVFSSNSKLSAALFALYEAMPALTDLQAERDALKARAEAAVTRAYERGRDDAAKALDTCGDSAVTEALGQRLCCNGHHCGCQGADVGAFLLHCIRALTPPADLAKGVK